MEVVLGLDNLIFIPLLTNKLPEPQRRKARRIGIGVALVFRLILLSTLALIVKLETSVAEALGITLSWQYLISIAGGLLLVWKTTREMHHLVDTDPAPTIVMPAAGFLLMIGTTLIADDLGFHIPRG